MADNQARIRLTATDETRRAFSSVERNLNGLNAQASKVGAAFAGLNARLVAGLGAAAAAIGFSGSAKAVIDFGDQLNKLSEISGVSIEDLNGLAFVVSQNEGSIEDLAKGFRGLNKAISEAGTGNAALQDLFNQLGLTEAAKGADDAQAAFLKLADVFPRLNEADRVRVAMELFGKAGENLIPTLSQGSAAIRQQAEEASKLLPITTDLAKQSDAFNDNLARLSLTFRGSLIPALNAVLGPLNDLLDKFIAVQKAASFGERFNIVASGLATKSLPDLKKQRDEQQAILDAQQKKFGRDPAFATAPNPVRERIGTIDAAIRVQESLRALQRQKAEALLGQKGVFDARDVRAGLDRPVGQLTLKPREKAEIGSKRGDIGRQALDQEIRRLHISLAEEQDLLQHRNNILDSLNQQNLLSMREFYSARDQLRRDALEKELSSLDAEADAIRRLASGGNQRERADAETRLIDIQARRAKAERQYTTEATADSARLRIQAKDYADQVSEITAELADLRGESAKAIEIRLRLRTENVPQEIKEVAGEQIAELSKRAILQARVSDQEARFSLDQQAASNAEARIDLARQSGQLSELEVLAKLGEARAKSVPQLQEVAANITAIAEATDDPRLRQLADNIQLQAEQAAAAIDPLRDKFRSITATGFEGFFTDLLDGTKSVSDAFKDMGKNIKRALDQLVAEDLSKKLYRAIFGSGGPTDLFDFGGWGGGGGGAMAGGGFGAGIGQWLASLFGGGSSIAPLLFEKGGIMTSGGESPLDRFTPGALTTMPRHRYASGGIASRPQLAIFGEGRRPEAFVPLPDGRNIPVVMEGGGGGQMLNQTVNIVVQGTVDARTSDQIAMQVGRATQRALRRKG